MTGGHLTEIPIVFYRTSGGVEPVRDWLRGLPGDDRRKIGFDLAAMQVGWPLGMPLCRSLGGRVMGNAQQLAEPPYRQSTVLRARRTDWRCARLYQEDTEDAFPGFRDRVKKSKRGLERMAV